MPALLGLRHVKKICATFGNPMVGVNFSSDSLNVLCWIRDDVKRFLPFVAHCSSEIRDVTIPEQWKHIPGSQKSSRHSQWRCCSEITQEQRALVVRASIPCEDSRGLAGTFRLLHRGLRTEVRKSNLASQRRTVNAPR